MIPIEDVSWKEMTEIRYGSRHQWVSVHITDNIIIIEMLLLSGDDKHRRVTVTLGPSYKSWKEDAAPT